MLVQLSYRWQSGSWHRVQPINIKMSDLGRLHEEVSPFKSSRARAPCRLALTGIDDKTWVRMQPYEAYCALPRVYEWNAASLVSTVVSPR